MTYGQAIKDRGSGQERETGQHKGRGLKGGFTRGPGGECLCPNCGHRIEHLLGVPSYTQNCSKCGSLMTRA
jgi:hypothetical protein